MLRAAVPGLPTARAAVGAGPRCLVCPRTAASSSAAARLRKSTDFYSLLGVLPTATQAEIKTAYYAMSMQYHPDKTAGNRDAAAKFAEIQGAYECLSQAHLRNSYDRGRTSGGGGGGGGGAMRNQQKKGAFDEASANYDFNTWFGALPLAQNPATLFGLTPCPLKAHSDVECDAAGLQEG